MKKVKIVPVNQQIIISVPKVEEEILSSGLVIPETAQEKPHTGVVTHSAHAEYKIGDVVMYRRYSGFNFELNDIEYLVIEAGDILVKLEETLEETCGGNK